MASSPARLRSSSPITRLRAHWRRYAAGMATETAFILALALFGLAIAVAARAVWP